MLAELGEEDVALVVRQISITDDLKEGGLKEEVENKEDREKKD